MTPLRLGGIELAFGGVTHVMGVINLSPDSRNRHTVAGGPAHALEMARAYREAGVSLIDLGGQSSHPDNPTIAPDEELARLLPALELLVAEGFLVAVDTWKPEVARRSVEAGAVMVNDTGGLANPAMRRVVSETGVAVVVVYVEAVNPHAVGEVIISDRKTDAIVAHLRRTLGVAENEGIDQLVVDPGIAVNYRGDYQAYTRMQLDVIRHLDDLRTLGRPVLIPIPRKREDHRVAAYITMAVEHGADLIRVHDVSWACDLVALLGRSPDR